MLSVYYDTTVQVFNLMPWLLKKHKIMATSKAWTRTLDLRPWTLTLAPDPQKPGP